MQTSPSPSLSSDAEDSAYCDYTILTGLFQYILQRLHYEIYPPYIINYADWDKEFNMPLAIDLCYELLKDNGNLILFQGWSNVCKTKTIMDEYYTMQDWIIYDRIKLNR